jgi:hypothetical protein
MRRGVSKILLIRIVWVRIIGIVRIRVIIGIGECEPDEDRIRSKKTAINEKTIIGEKVAVSSKRATAESIILPKSEAAARPRPYVTSSPSAHVTAKSPRADRQSPKDCAYQKDTKLFHLANG